MKYKELSKLTKADLDKKLKELKLELVKSKAAGAKTGNSRPKQIRKIIARILTLNKIKLEVKKASKGSEQVKASSKQSKDSSTKRKVEKNK